MASCDVAPMWLRIRTSGKIFSSSLEDCHGHSGCVAYITTPVPSLRHDFDVDPP